MSAGAAVGQRLGVDIGGTFTDFALLDEASGALTVLKVPSTPARPSGSVFTGIAELRRRHGLDTGAIRAFVHGTTLAVNTIIERKGARAGLLITRGFRDVLNIGRHRIPDVFNFFAELPAPLVPRAHVIEIPERTLADGRVAQRPDEAVVAGAVDALVADGVTAIAVCYLHSYRNPANEQATRRVIEARAPQLYVSVSAELWPQMREYERALVAVMNAYVGHRMSVYFGDLERGLRDLGLAAPVLSTKSNGGVMTASEAGLRPVETLLSGPAAGVIGASFAARQAGHERVITFDMGGTSADVAVVDGEPRFSTENSVGDFPVIMPAIDVTSIGAGGGSIAWTDRDGVLKVGPHSAGAAPGPACYGQGGTDPTVTDAYVALGIVDPARFLGGSVPLDPRLAEAALATLGARLGLDVAATAEAVLRVATSQMYAALVPLMARKAVDLDRFALLPFGGAGPTHGFLLAREVGIRRVIIPPSPGVLCAIGSLVADVRRDFVHTVHTALRRGQEGPLLGAMREAFRRLASEGAAWLAGQGLDFEGTHGIWSLDLRYLGQSFELTVPVTGEELADETGEALRRRFHRSYFAVYGFTDEAADLEVLNLRATAIGVTRKPAIAAPRAAAAGAAPGRERRVFLDGRWLVARVADRDALGAGTALAGPAIIEQYDTTVLVPPGFTVTLDHTGTLIGEGGECRSPRGYGMTTDKVLLEVLNNRFTGIVEEMGYIIHRASFTVFVKETWDFDSALVSPDGEIFCYPRNIGVTNMLGMHMGDAIRCIRDYAPGDVIVTNDPHRTRGMCTHLPDIMMFRPLFAGGRLLAFAWCFIHSSDVGGLVPGSISPTAFDRFQEGIAIPPTKLVRAGELNQELLDLILANCRIPDQNWGDMKALLAALATCERRMEDVVARYGEDAVRAVIPQLLEYGERRARAVFEAIPDGSYEFWDYVEGDLFSRYHVRIKVRVEVSGSDIHLDFTGTDPQIRAALNMPTYDKPNQWLVLGLVNYLRTTDRSLPLNRGILRPVRVTVPKGSLLNPLPFVATGARHAVGYRVSDSVLGALSRAVPQQIPAAGAGQVAIVLLSHLDPESGQYRVNVLQPMQGGCGARPTKDGIDGVNFSAGSLRNVPTESIELEAPVVVQRYMLADQTAAGRYRGGAGVVFEFQVNAPNTIITARGMERMHIRPWGRKGAEPGTLGATIAHPGTPEERPAGKIDVLKLAPGETLRILSPGGGGYGDPFERDPELVQRDVANGFYTATDAAERYGVVLDGARVDEEATRRRRAGRVAPGTEFSVGPEREAYERRLPPAVQDAVAAELQAYSGSYRNYLKEQVYDALTANGATALDPVALRERVRAVLKSVRLGEPTAAG